MADDQNIFELTTDCDEAFNRIATDPAAVCAPVVEKLHERFDEWAKHLGARAAPSLSLDTRLMHSKTLRELVSNYLQIAKSCLDSGRTRNNLFFLKRSPRVSDTVSSRGTI